jgi:hypothetical protein
MTCQTCPRPKTITLATDAVCCSWCESHLIECEARELLSIPLEARRERLSVIEGKRGNIDKLKSAMIAINNKRKRV